jgi:hypothetical protein
MLRCGAIQDRGHDAAGRHKGQRRQEADMAFGLASRRAIAAKLAARSCAKFLSLKWGRSNPVSDPRRDKIRASRSLSDKLKSKGRGRREGFGGLAAAPPMPRARRNDILPHLELT